MKKTVFVLFAIAVFGFSSCKKDEAASPVKFPTDKVADKSNVGTWD